ncbi:MAG: diguanylate cyclase domain-containing protein [Labedaea sp.]
MAVDRADELDVTTDENLRMLAKTWLRAVTASAYVPMSMADLEEYLHGLVVTLTEALEARPFSAQPGTEVGSRMVAGQIIGLDTLTRSVDVLADALLDLGEPDRTRSRQVVALLAAVCSGYADAQRRRTLAQQENMRHALLAAKQRAERDRQATERRFREVFTSSPVGLALTDASGRFIETNSALAKILACTPEMLDGASLADYLAEDLRGSFEEPPTGRVQLLRADGDTAWVFVASSPLRDGTDAPPASHVITVQDLSELQLLQGRFGHQLVRDALTGVANRIYFQSTLETRLGRARPEATVTLCCLDLDAFSVLNDGLGDAAGDHLLRTIAKRLEDVVSGEEALVARTGADEFAILVEDAEHTPDIPELVRRVNEALAEPEYVDGCGVAPAATIGVVRTEAGAMSGAELFRAACAAMHHARAAGRRQWMHFDPVADQRVRQDNRDATALPGAFESGELAVRYEPVVRLADRATVGLRAALHWSGRAGGPLDERETMRLAERTGQSVALGPALLRSACANPNLARLAGREPALRIRLSRLQSADDDLVSAVLGAIAAVDLPPNRLELAFDTGAVLGEFGSAPDNLNVIADIGVRAALCGFGGGPAELALLARSPARSVVLAEPVAAALDNHPVVADAVAMLVGSITQLGAAVSVDGVRTEEEAVALAGIGVHTAQGPLFGAPAELEQILSGEGNQTE